MRYQHTPTASKGNAFCWESWTPQIAWSTPAQEAGHAKRADNVDAKRSTGIDPLFIAGLSSAARQNPLTPARMAMRSWSRRRGGSA